MAWSTSLGDTPPVKWLTQPRSAAVGALVCTARTLLGEAAGVLGVAVGVPEAAGAVGVAPDVLGAAAGEVGAAEGTAEGTEPGLLGPGVVTGLREKAVSWARACAAREADWYLVPLAVTTKVTEAVWDEPAAADADDAGFGANTRDELAVAGADSADSVGFGAGATGEAAA